MQETASDQGCQPGEASEEVPGGSTLTPTGPQETTFYVIAGFFVCRPFLFCFEIVWSRSVGADFFVSVDLIGWHLIFVRDLIFPAKVCVVMWHELGEWDASLVLEEASF